MGEGLTPIGEAMRAQAEALASSVRRRGMVVAPDPAGVVDVRGDRWRAICPRRFHAADVSTVDLGDAYTGWCERRDAGNLMLLGPVGVGKSWAAAAAARSRFVDSGDDVVWTSAIELLDRLRPGADDPVDVGRVCTVDVLVIDDLGAERPTEWTAERLLRIVDARWAEMLPTVVTANRGRAGLVDALGERTVSRLYDEATVVVITGDDRRGPRGT